MSDDSLEDSLSCPFLTGATKVIRRFQSSLAHRRPAKNIGMSQSPARSRHGRHERRLPPSRVENIIDVLAELGESIHQGFPESWRHNGRNPQINIVVRWWLKFVFMPDVTVASLAESDWTATMFVQVEDLPRLMREGFFWDLENVRESEGGFATDDAEATYDSDALPDMALLNSPQTQRGLWIGRCCVPLQATNQGWKHARYYYLEDRSEQPCWKASIGVYARDLGFLKDFSLDMLDLSHVAGIYGSDVQGRKVYNYDANHPHRNFNHFYNNRPLGGGWWPRPTAAQEEQARPS